MSTFGPVRKIGIQTRSMTGTMPDGNRYESALERDFMELVRSDPDFDRYYAQPVTISLKQQKGEPSSYTPDGLVFWKSDRPPWLVEVKYRADCVGNFRLFLLKFRAAKRYALEHGWEFHVMTEDRIRGHKLLNARFLNGYQGIPEASPLSSAIVQAVRNGHRTPFTIIEALGTAGLCKATALTQLWRLVANGVLKINHDEELTMATTLSLAP